VNREVELATLTMQQCQLRLRRVQEQVRDMRELLRRAVRAADDAELELGEATQRLTRMETDRPSEVG
jgi:septation ring formation regulator EzrA